MTQRRHRVVEYHSRPSISHHLADALAHIRPIAMGATLRTKTLLLHKGTEIGTSIGVVGQLSTLVTQPLSGVVGTAVESDHIAHDTFFVLDLAF